MLPGSLALAIEFNLFLRRSEQEPHWGNVIAGCSTCNEAQTKCVRDTSVVSIVPLDRDSPFMPGKHGTKVRSDYHLQNGTIAESEVIHASSDENVLRWEDGWCKYELRITPVATKEHPQASFGETR